MWTLGPLLGALAAGYAQGHSAVFFTRVDDGEELTVNQVHLHLIILKNVILHAQQFPIFY